MQKNEDIFIGNLPKPISKKETIELFMQMHNGSNEARNKLITHNLRLVMERLNTRFKNVDYDKQDLFSIGVDGLERAINTFDINKGTAISTYAARCIDNEILMFLRTLKKNERCISLDDVMFTNNEGDTRKVKDTLSSNIDIEEDYIERSQRMYIKAVVNILLLELPDREREIIKLYYGFYDDKCYKQSEIAKKMNISQSYVTRLIKKTLIILRERITSFESSPNEAIFNLTNNTGEKGPKKNIIPDNTIIDITLSLYTKEELQNLFFEIMNSSLTLHESMIMYLYLSNALNNRFSIGNIYDLMQINKAEITRTIIEALRIFKNKIKELPASKKTAGEYILKKLNGNKNAINAI